MPISGREDRISTTVDSFRLAHQSSPSRNAMISPCACGMPKLNAEAWPPFSLRKQRTRGANLPTISGVPSVDPSSTTRISVSEGGKSCSRTLTIASSMKRSWLYVSIKTVAATLFVIEENPYLAARLPYRFAERMEGVVRILAAPSPGQAESFFAAGEDQPRTHSARL